MNKRLKAFEKGAEYLDRKMGKRIRFSSISGKRNKKYFK
jgi:hypothetical protein